MARFHSGSRPAKASNPYSPILCIALLVIIGLVVELSPMIQEYLAYARLAQIDN